MMLLMISDMLLLEFNKLSKIHFDKYSVTNGHIVRSAEEKTSITVYSFETFQEKLIQYRIDVHTLRRKYFS